MVRAYCKEPQLLKALDMVAGLKSLGLQGKYYMKTNIHSHCSAFCTGLRVMAIPLSRQQDPAKSGHWYLLCLPNGQGQFLLAYTCSLGFILAWKKRIFRVGEETRGSEF